MHRLDEKTIPSATYGRIAKRIGIKLRDFYDHPESEALPAEHVNLLLQLRHKERSRARERS